MAQEIDQRDAHWEAGPPIRPIITIKIYFELMRALTWLVPTSHQHYETMLVEDDAGTLSGAYQNAVGHEGHHIRRLHARGHPTRTNVRRCLAAGGWGHR